MLGCEVELLESVVDDAIHVLDVLELAVEDQVLSNSHLCEKNVDLGAKTDEVSDVLVVCEQVNGLILDIVDESRARCRLCNACKHV